MEKQQEINYNRVAQAISFYRDNYRDQPSLEKVAEHVHLSPFHFQRMFKEWAGRNTEAISAIPHHWPRQKNIEKRHERHVVRCGLRRGPFRHQPAARLVHES